jgi:hypothetical protein
VNAANATLGELMDREFGVDADVFDDQHTQAVQLQVARHSCLTLGGLMRASGDRCLEWGNVSFASPTSGCTHQGYCGQAPEYLSPQDKYRMGCAQLSRGIAAPATARSVAAAVAPSRT